MISLPSSKVATENKLIAYDDKYYKIIAVEAPINYSRLIYARLYAEQMYIDFRDEAPAFIKYIFTVMILLIQE